MIMTKQYIICSYFAIALIAMIWISLISGEHYPDILHRNSTSRSCRDLTRQEGIFASLFTTLAALTIMSQNKDHFGYKFDFTIADGTLIAQQRNELIFPWDSDADTYILFENNLSVEELEKFRLDLKNVIFEYIDKLKNNDNVTLPEPTKLENVKIDEYDKIASKQSEIVYSNDHCNNKTCITWNVLHGKRDPKQTGNIFYLLHIETIAEASGSLDLFIMYYNDNKTQIRNDHCCVGFLRDFQDVSLIFPAKTDGKWSIYENINVPIPRQYRIVLEKDYGANWTVPNVDIQTQKCDNFGPETIHDFFNNKYKHVVDIVKTDISQPIFRSLLSKMSTN